MPRALEVLEHLLRQLERGEISALEAIDNLLDEELSLREGRRVKAALKMGRLLTIKTLAGFDFSFQPSLDRNRILTLAGLDFIAATRSSTSSASPAAARPTWPSPLPSRRSRPAAASTSPPSPSSSARSPRPSVRAPCASGIRFLCRPQLLVVDEIGYLPVVTGGGNLFFQLVNARYERGAMILTSNRGFAEWGEVFGDTVVATALLDRLLHHAIVVRIEGASYRLRRHADLLPDTSTTRPIASAEPEPRRRGRPPKPRNSDLTATT